MTKKKSEQEVFSQEQNDDELEHVNGGYSPDCRTPEICGEDRVYRKFASVIPSGD